MDAKKIAIARRKIEALRKAEFISIFEVYGLCEMSTEALDALVQEQEACADVAKILRDEQMQIRDNMPPGAAREYRSAYVMAFDIVYKTILAKIS